MPVVAVARLQNDSHTRIIMVGPQAGSANGGTQSLARHSDAQTERRGRPSFATTLATVALGRVALTQGLASAQIAAWVVGLSGAYVARSAGGAYCGILAGRQAGHADCGFDGGFKSSPYQQLTRFRPCARLASNVL